MTERDIERQTGYKTRLIRQSLVEVMTFQGQDHSGDESSAQLTELIGRFRRKLPLRCEELKKVVYGEDWLSAEALAHKLQGAAGSYGFMKVKEIASEIETACKMGQKQAVFILLQHLGNEVSSLENG